MIPFWPTLHGHTVEMGFLENSIRRSSVAHAIIFSGPESVGKRICALEFSRMLFENHRPEFDHLSLLTSGTHPDFHFIEKPDDKKDISVEQIRSLLSNLKLKPYYQGAIVAVIDDAHLLNKSAANALLKTLEEPNQNTYLLLISDRPHLLLETVRSRCQPLSFGSLSQSNCQKIITDICNAAKIEEAAIKDLSKITEGSLQSLSLSALLSRHSNAIIDQKEFVGHLSKIASTVSLLTKKIERVLEDFEASAQSDLVSHIAEFEIQETNSPLFWQTLRNLISIRMRTSSQSEVSNWAKLLQNAVEIEFNTQRRSANAQLQLCSSFLEEHSSK